LIIAVRFFIDSIVEYSYILKGLDFFVRLKMLRNGILFFWGSKQGKWGLLIMVRDYPFLDLVLRINMI